MRTAQETCKFIPKPWVFKNIFWPISFIYSTWLLFNEKCQSHLEYCCNSNTKRWGLSIAPNEKKCVLWHHILLSLLIQWQKRVNQFLFISLSFLVSNNVHLNPPYLCDMLTSVQQSSASSGQHLLVVPGARGKQRGHCVFAEAGLKLWNLLPLE